MVGIGGDRRPARALRPRAALRGTQPHGSQTEVVDGLGRGRGKRRFYHAGDTGYFGGFAEIGKRFGPIDLAAMPIGAYLPREMMRIVHVNPEEAARAAVDVGARRVLAMHFGTFDLADEPLDEPPRLFRAEAERLGLGPDRAWVLNIGETREW